MKNILIILSFMLLGFKAQAQQLIVPIDELSKYHEKYGILPEATYFKDVNGILDKYTGTWEGSLGNKKYSFKITKKIGFTHKKISTSILNDGLFIQFKIIDTESGRILYNNFDLPEEFQLVFSNYLEVTKDKYSIYYVGNSKEEINCGDKDFMQIELIKADSMKVYVKPSLMEFYYNEGEEHPCPGGRVLPPFPNPDQTPLVLIKK